MKIEAGDLVEVSDITSPFYGHAGKVVRRIEGWEAPRYFIVEMDFMIVTQAHQALNEYT
jgi:hypothetical protein